uniref:Uncharacterized protein n=1 Tax=Terrapene triunguis TaxID=2587831 RepID=A0A674IBB3_9SAUR
NINSALRVGSVMGTFQGQALPGTFFLLFGLWLAVKCPLKYLYQKINPSVCTNLLMLTTWQHTTMYLFFGISVHDDSPHVHLLLIVALCGDALSLHLEVFVPHHPRPISFVLYPPGGWPDWDQMDDGNIMFSTRCVCWHYVAALIIVVFNYTIVTASLTVLCSVSIISLLLNRGTALTGA